MTKAAKHFGKTLENFMRSPETLEYIDALSKAVKNTELKQATQGRYGGTWAHPKLAVFFARVPKVLGEIQASKFLETSFTSMASATQCPATSTTSPSR